MKLGKILIFLFFVIWFFLGVKAVTISSNNFQILEPTISSGGKNVSSGNFKTNFILGTITGNISSSSFDNFLGFFYLLKSDTTTPLISFIPPTLPNGAFSMNYTIETNVSIIETNLSNYNFSWNFVNYSLYDDSLILFLNFDNRSSLGENDTFVRDLSKYKHDSIAVDASFASTFGRHHGSYDFDGNNDNINIADSNLLDLTGNFTIMAWIYPRTFGTTSDGHIIDHEEGIGNGWLLKLDEGCDFTLALQINDVEYCADDRKIRLKEWQHIVVTFEDGNLKFYWNTLPTGRFAGVSYALASSIRVRLGLAQDGESFDYDGFIDEVMIFNRALNEEEVKFAFYSNLYKYNLTQWYHYFNVEQPNFKDGNHTFKARASDIFGNMNMTELRSLNVTNFPQISFVSPTPKNGKTTSDITPEINVSLFEPYLGEFIFNFNNTNYSLYDGNLILMLNLDNNSALGENDYNVKDLSLYRHVSDDMRPTFVSNGKYGGAYEVTQGFGQHGIDITDSDLLDLTGNFTITAWIYPRSFGNLGVGRIISHGGTNSNPRAGWTFLLNNNCGGILNALRMFINNNNTIPALCSNANSISLHKWQHVAVTMNGTLSFYVNSLPNGSYTDVPYPIARNVNNTDVTIGEQSTNDEGEFDGFIDEVRIWNRTLNQDEIKQVYYSNLNKYNKTQWYFYTNPTLENGNYTYKAIAADAAGNMNMTELRSLFINTSFSECLTITEEDSVFNLQTNIKSTGTCISITTNKVEVNCQGFEINYSYAGIEGYGIISNASNTIIKNCKIIEGTNVTNNKFGIYLNNSDSSLISNNTIIAIGSSSHAIHLLDSDSANIIDNMLNTSGISASGLHFTGSSAGSNVNNTKINTINNNAFAIHVVNGSHVFEVKDSILDSSFTGIVEFLGNLDVVSGSFNLTNVTFDDTDVIGNGTLNVKWYLDVNVTDSLSAPIFNADVNITDIFGAFKITNTTINGLIPTEEVIEYSENNTERRYFSNYTVTASKLKYTSKSVQYNNTANTYLQITLNKLPDIVLEYPINGKKLNINSMNGTNLNFSVNDLENEPLDIDVYGSVDVNRLSEFLMYRMKNISGGNFSVFWNGRIIDAQSSGLAALYHLNNQSEFGENDSLVNDFSANNNDGTVVGAIFNGTGYFAGAFEFDGVDDYINVGNPSSLNHDFTSLTIAFWMYAASTGTDAGLVGKGTTVYGTTYHTDSNVYFYITEGANHAKAPVSQNQWHHIAGTFNGTALKLYVDGELANIKNPSSTSSTGTGGTFTIGKATSFFNGLIDEAAIWNRALTDSEIENLAKLSLGRYFWGVNASDGNGWNFEQTNFKVVDPPFIDNLIVNSSLGTNYTFEDLFCYADVIDDPNPNEFASVHWKWYRNNILFDSGETDMRTETEFNSNMRLFFHFNNDSNFGENDIFIFDHSGKGHNATAACATSGGPCPRVIDGYFGKAFNFTYVLGETDGNRLVIQDHDDLSLNTESTITAWVYTRDDPSNGIVNDHEILTHKGSGDTGYTFGVTDDPAAPGRLRFDFKPGTGSEDIYSNDVLTNDTWHFVAAVRSGTTITFYIDGINNGGGTISSSSIINPSSEMRIGDSSVPTDDSQEGWDGYIEELSIWNVSLTAVEIDTLYKRGKGVGILKEIAFVNATDTFAGDEWTCSVFASNQVENETDVNNASLTCLYDGPFIKFIANTPPNGAFTENLNVEINISTSDFIGNKGIGIKELTFNWNGTNYTFYNDSLTLMYNFDNRSSLGENDNFIRDLSRYGNNGTINGAISIINGVYEKAIEFPGGSASDYVNVSHRAMDNLDDFSVTLWLRKDDDIEQGVITGANNTQDNEFLIFTSQNNLYVYIKGNNPGDYIGVGDPNLANGLFHFVSFVRNDLTGSLYIDGNFVRSRTYASSATLDINFGGLFLGQEQDSLGGGFQASQALNGAIDELRIWNKTLSAQEIQEMYYSNLYKYNETQWYLYINQSNLTEGVYTYYSSVADLDGNTNMTEIRTLNVNITALPPVIEDIHNISAQFINPGTVKFVNFNVIVLSNVGFGAIDNVNGSINSGNVYRNDLSCSFINNIDSFRANYSCSVDLWYFDESGEWNVTAAAVDNEAGHSNPYKETFLVGSDRYVTHKAAIRWTNLAIGQMNVYAKEALLLNNIGNDNIDNGEVNVTAKDLHGEAITSESIPVANITVSLTNSSSICIGNDLINGAGVIVTGALLPKGNNSLNYKNETSGQEELFFCIEHVPEGISLQTYSATGSNSWQLTFPDFFYNATPV